MKLAHREPLVIGTAASTNQEGDTVLTNSDARKGQIAMEETTLPAVPLTEAQPAPPRTPLLPEQTDFLEGGEAPAAAKVEAFLAQAFAATGSAESGPGARALDLRRAPVEPFGQGLRPRPHGLPPAHAGAGRHAAGGRRRPRQALQAPLLEAGRTSATVARRLSVIRAPTRNWRPRDWCPGRRPRTSVRSRPPACRRTPHRP